MTTVYPEVWIPTCIISLIFFLLTFRLVIKERKARKSENIQFTTKYLAFWSALCITTAPIASLIGTLRYFPGFCYISAYLFRINAFAGLIFVGYYQLARLYYCFARDKVHSNKGYPNWLFLIMFAIAFVFYFTFIFFNLDHYTISCGINNKYQAYYNKSRPVRDPKWISYVSVIALAVCIIWDLVTLMLYIYKIRVFTKCYNNNTKVENRILSILYKITIITLFYHFVEILTLFCVFWLTKITPIIDGVTVVNFYALLYSYSMYIMMDHNKKSYQWFLKILYKFRLYLVCYCCCKRMVIQQLDDTQLLEQTMADNKNKNPPTIENTEYDTTMHDISVNHAKIQIRQTQFSHEIIID